MMMSWIRFYNCYMQKNIKKMRKDEEDFRTELRLLKEDNEMKQLYKVKWKKKMGK